jgi:sugar phosphate isomerase/epimerase
LQIGSSGFFHLTYCTKIHPAHGWEDLLACITGCVPLLKARLGVTSPFGLGLRLSDLESQQLLEGDRLAAFQEFLKEHGIYVFTVNGFPFGSFRGPVVKAEVFAPDWRQEARLAYTRRLIGILAELLPEGVEGSISTLPLSYKPWIAPDDGQALRQITGNLARVVLLLRTVREEQGKFIHLDLEPEADALLENSAEVVKFFSEWLLPYGGELLAGWTGLSLEQAREELREYIQVCLDTCHMAVAYEDPAAVVEALTAHGIRVGKVQVTSGLKFAVPGGREERRACSRALMTLAHSPYLHQVTAKREDGSLHQSRDLATALPRLPAVLDREWRIHFHMPLFARGYEGLSTTQAETREVLLLLKERGFCRHLELETYTWEVLPEALQLDIVDSLEREYLWTMEILGPGSGERRHAGQGCRRPGPA